MSRAFTLLGGLMLGLVGVAVADTAQATDYAIADTEALIRTAPPELKSTGKRIPYGAIVVVIEEKAVGKEYVNVRMRDDPRTVFGWTAKSNLGVTKEFDQAMMAEDSVDVDSLLGTKRTMASLYNARGKYLKSQAKELEVSASDLAAVLKVESGGRAFGNDGRTIIRFENHVFWKQWGEMHKDKFNQHFKFGAVEGWKEHEWRKTVRDGWTACHATQLGEWEVLEYAKSLDEKAALASASLGIGQIMGFNHKSVGFTTPQEMVKTFDAGIKPQLDAFIAFINGTPKCMKGLKTKDYTLFAEGYNGTGQAADYGAGIKEAADAYAEVSKGKKHGD